jgi:MFS family permease
MASSAKEPVNEEGSPSPALALEATVQHNLLVECLYSAFTGIFMGMILFAGPVIAYTCLDATTLELTIIVSAFPCGAFMGPLWAGLGQRWGMKGLVLYMAIGANLPLFLMFWVNDAAVFTAVIVVSQLLHSAMRMGQSSMYRASYPRHYLGKVLGRLTFCTFATMVPTVLLAGWLSKEGNYPESYRWLYPVAAVAGLIGCQFYARLRLLEKPHHSPPGSTIRESIQHVRKVLISDRAYMLFQLAFFLSGSAFFLSAHITLKLSHDRLHFSAAELALWLAVLPQILLAVSSVVWGQFLNRLGIVRARLVIGMIMTIYLSCYFAGITLGLPALIYCGSVLRGLAEGGGQVTWALASVHFAPKAEDVPLYNGIHFVLNGIRGLMMPAIGTALYLVTGQWTILMAAGVAAASIFVAVFGLRYGEGPIGLALPSKLDVPEADAELEGG